MIPMIFFARRTARVFAALAAGLAGLGLLLASGAISAALARWGVLAAVALAGAGLWLPPRADPQHGKHPSRQRGPPPLPARPPR